MLFFANRFCFSKLHFPIHCNQVKKTSVSSLQELRNTVAVLRAPNGCPWDIEQTHQSLAVCLIDECCELLETLDRLDMPHMREELGDVLLQVVMHAQIAEEAGHFNLEDVAAEVNEKLIRRHPHVFGDMDLKDSDAVLKQWDAIKAQEKKNGREQESHLFKNLPPMLPALLYARDIFKQIQKKELDRRGRVDQERISELAEGLDEEKAGQLLFELTAACRKQGIDPESALRRYGSQLMDTLEDDHRN